MGIEIKWQLNGHAKKWPNSKDKWSRGKILGQNGHVVKSYVHSKMRAVFRQSNEPPLFRGLAAHTYITLFNPTKPKASVWNGDTYT